MLVTKQSIPEDLLKRLKSDGYLLLRLDRAVYQAVTMTFNAAYPFFRAPADEKITSRLPEDCGYRPIGIEYSQSPDRPDLAESFTVCRRGREAAAQLRSPRAKTLYRHMLLTYDAIIIRLADALSSQQAGKRLRGTFRRWSRLQINYSRPAGITEPLINESHEDGNVITIACATGPGFEIQDPGDNYLPVTTLSHEALIFPGEITWLLSGGQIRPLYHRVRPEPRCVERLALLFFGDIAPQSCQPWVRNDMNANVNIGERVRISVTRFGLAGFELD
jgi:isopenicillin N synthase-like dioxygenase